MKNIYDPLLQNQLIDPSQHAYLKQVHTRKIVSLYYELRLLLYLGIMLFTGGVGYLVYTNIGSAGHLAMMALLGAGIFACFHFVGKIAVPYSNLKTENNHVYFDYLVLLAALLIVSLFTYILVYFELQSIIGYTSFISAAILFFMAYRYDNRALLSMGITALAAAVGIGITPVDWAEGDLFTGSRLYITSMALGVVLVVLGEMSDRKAIKAHFNFTYQNFGYILYFVGAVSATFASDYQIAYALLTLVSAALAAYRSWIKKEFLFFLYASIAGYIALTYLVFEFIEGFSWDYWILIYYFPASCIGYILFLINKKSHFAND
jgi:hypothetical protein